MLDTWPFYKLRSSCLQVLVVFRLFLELHDQRFLVLMHFHSSKLFDGERGGGREGEKELGKEVEIKGGSKEGREERRKVVRVGGCRQEAK